MRKALILLVVFAVVGAAAFADTAMGPTAKWSVGTWAGFGLAGSNLVAYDYSWVGGGAVRLGFNYTAADGNAGLNARFQTGANASDLVQVNQINGWAKMFGGMLTVRGGLLDDYTLATKDWNCFGNTDGQYGLFFDVSPVAGLDIGFFQVVPTTNMFDKDIVGLAYTLKDTVSVQAGAYLASSAGTTASTATTPMATAPYFGASILAVKGLTAILEGKVSLYTDVTVINLEQNLAYAAGPITVGARIGEVDSSTFDWGVEPTVSYKVNDNFTFNVIANIYSDPVGGVLGWMSPADAGVLGSAAVPAVAANPATYKLGSAAVAASGVYATTGMNYGGGASINYAVDGMTVTVGDYYSVSGGNIVYVNADLSL